MQVSFFCFIWKPMLKVYGHFNVLNFSSAVIDFRRQNWTNRRQILTSQVDHCTERVKRVFIIYYTSTKNGSNGNIVLFTPKLQIKIADFTFCSHIISLLAVDSCWLSWIKRHNKYHLTVIVGDNLSQLISSLGFIYCTYDINKSVIQTHYAQWWEKLENNPPVATWYKFTTLSKTYCNNVCNCLIYLTIYICSL